MTPNILSWLRWVGLVILLLVLWGIGYKTFIQRTEQNIIRDGGKIINITGEKETPILGCSIHKIKAKLVWQ